jgi:transposase
MDVLYRCCAGLDVHKKTVVACVRRLGDDGQFESEVLTFGTTTAELLALSDWLAGRGVTHAAMESTGIYWKPVWRILEGAFELLLVNARHIKQVPGRKTDVKDCQWIADLLRHGLLRAALCPNDPKGSCRNWAAIGRLWCGSAQLR